MKSLEDKHNILITVRINQKTKQKLVKRAAQVGTPPAVLARQFIESGVGSAK